jgi:hypothetical protein
MRVKLAIGAAAGFVVSGLAVAVLLFAGSPDQSVPLFVVGLVLAILGFVGGTLFLVYSIVLPLFGGARSFVTPVQLQEMVAGGRVGFARVLSATPTGAQLNNAWAYDAELVVDRTGVPTYKLQTTIRVSRYDGLLRGGEIISVGRVDADKPEVTVTAGPARTPQDTPVPQDALPWS